MLFSFFGITEKSGSSDLPINNGNVFPWVSQFSLALVQWNFTRTCLGEDFFFPYWPSPHMVASPRLLVSSSASIFALLVWLFLWIPRVWCAVFCHLTFPIPNLLSVSSRVPWCHLHNRREASVEQWIGWSFFFAIQYHRFRKILFLFHQISMLKLQILLKSPPFNIISTLLSTLISLFVCLF